MKKALNLLAIIAVIAAVQSCKPQIDAVIGDPGSKLDGINATWSLSAAQIVDNNSLNGDSISLTHYYKDNDGAPEITFNSSTFEYSVEDHGKKNFFSTGGTWAFDDEEYPTMIQLTTTEGVVIDLELTRTIRPQDPKLMINYSRDCNNAAYATYYFEYVRK